MKDPPSAQVADTQAVTPTPSPPVGGGRASCSVELAAILRDGWPNSVNMVLMFLPGMAMLSFLGSNPDHLAAAGMGFMFVNVSGISIIMGFGAGAQPLESQAFGAKNFVRCGELLQRQLAIHILVCIGVAAVWLNAEHILLTFKQPAHISKLTAQFVLWRVPSLPFYAAFTDIQNYLVAQRVMRPPMLISIFCNVANVMCFPMLIARFGFVGAPLAMTLSNIAQAIFAHQVAWRVLPCSEAWPCWRWRTAFSGWGEMLKLALPAGVLMLSEWWGWEMNLFFAGLLCDDDTDGNAPDEVSCVELDVFPIVANTMVISFMCTVGFSTAAATHVGNALGAGDAHGALRSVRVNLMLVSWLSGGIAGSMLLLRNVWGALFSADPVVVGLTGQVLPLVAAYIFLDALGPGALVALLRNMGVVRLPALINFLSFYALGIPVGLALTFGRGDGGWGIRGLWAGLVLGMFAMVTSLLTFMFRCVVWPQLAQESQTRARGNSASGAPSLANKVNQQIFGRPSTYERLALDPTGRRNEGNGTAGKLGMEKQSFGSEETANDASPFTPSTLAPSDDTGTHDSSVCGLGPR